ncbi:MAG: hypothetical protein M3P26_07380 [Gemmatimonadota bacterium]|nr:hypothetical protein [Gemmatimonadota bacterium]
MAWTLEQKLSYLLLQPWTIIPDLTPEGDKLLRVQELPAAVGTGENDEALTADFWESLRSTLEAYLQMGARPPLPATGVKVLPWEKTAKEARLSGTFQMVRGQTIQVRTSGPGPFAIAARENGAVLVGTK